MFLRQSTSQIIRFGPFVDSTDGVTPETALTIAQADMQLSKDGGAFAQKNAAGNATHDTDGWYSTTLNTTDTATTGELKIQVNVAGALPVWETYFIVTATAYDSLQIGTFNNVAATDVVSAGAITTSSGSVSSVTTVATTTTNTDMRGTDSAATATNLATVDSNIDAILVDTNDLQTNQGNWLTATGFATTAEIADVPTVAEFNARTIPSADYFVVTDYTVPPTSAAISTAVWGETTRVLTAGTNLNDVSVSDILTTQMTESYSADGTSPTLAQSLFLIQQNLQDFSFAGTTQTVKKIDGSTTAATYTLDDATAPTSKTRAS